MNAILRFALLVAALAAVSFAQAAVVESPVLQESIEFQIQEVEESCDQTKVSEGVAGGNMSGDELADRCCVRCSAGKPCGNSCINRNYTCRQPPGCAC